MSHIEASPSRMLLTVGVIVGALGVLLALVLRPEASSAGFAMAWIGVVGIAAVAALMMRSAFSARRARVLSERVTRDLEAEIARRREAEAALRATRERYQMLFTAIDEGFVVAEVVRDAGGKPVDYRVVAANPAFERVTGLRDVVGKTAVELVPHFERHWRAALSHVAETGQSQRLRNELKALGRWFDVFLFRVGPEAVGGLMADVTERRRVDEALRDSEQQLGRATTLLRTLSETIPDPMFAKDLEGRLLLANPATLRVIGRPAEEVLGRTEAEWLEVPEQAARILENDRRVMSSGVTEVVEEEVDTPEGRRVFLGTKAPLRDQDGRVAGLVGVSRDITERIAMETALREGERRARDLAETLRDADRRKDEFLATLAHELRNPLAAIRYALTLLEPAAAGNPATRRSWDVISRQFTQLTRLIDDLLDVSRITRNKIQLRCERVGMAALVQAVVESLEPQIVAAGRCLIVKRAGDGDLHADAARIVQVFTNLLNNATKFTAPGGTIVFASALEGDHAVLRVSDNGVGIPAEALPHVFDMFHQADRMLERSAGGLGIGLSLARRLVEMHGGTIQAQSDGRNKGAEFVVRLPLAGVAESGRDIAAPVAATPAQPSLRALRVLIVDDNVDSAEMLAVLVHANGHLTRVVHDGLTALAAFDQFDPEVVLLDIGLPGLNGYDVCRALRARAKHTLHIVAITGWGEAEDRRLAREAGFHCHMTKPADPALITEYLEAAAHDNSCSGCERCLRGPLTRYGDAATVAARNAEQSPRA